MLYMVRTQIQLDEEQHRALKEAAAARGVSVAALVRQGIELVLGEDERKARIRRAMAIAGKGHSGLSDVAQEHDKYLAEDARW